jgi:hypothetical protein
MQTDPLYNPSIDARLIGLLSSATRVSRRSQRQIAASAGINKDALARSLRGERRLGAAEVLQVLAVAGLPSRGALLLALVADEDQLDRWLGSEAAEFLDTLLASLPSALAIELGDNLPELRSKWGIAAARMIAKRIAEHIAEAARRDDALGAALG